MKIKRKMVHIDEDKCDGCGLCIPGCAEGALQIIDGKAKLVSDVYCDGLGACLGDCPQDAISMVEREAEVYDEDAVEKHLVDIGRDPLSHKSDHQSHDHSHDHSHGEEQSACGCSSHPQPVRPVKAAGGGCPGMAVKSIERSGHGHGHGGGCCGSSNKSSDEAPMVSELTNWPVQITLMPPVAPYLANAKLLIAADCVPMAFADFHKNFVKGRVALMGCPKLDNAQSYIEKLTMVFANNVIVDVVVPYMEVPCCGGLLRIVSEAVKHSGKDIVVKFVKIGINGTILGEHSL